MDNKLLFEQWSNGIRIFHISHHFAASYYSRLNIMLGITVIIITSLVGTAIFSSLKSEPNIIIKIIIGLVSVCAAILSALQTFLRFSERSEKHKNAAVKYGALRRELDALKIRQDCTNELKLEIKEFRLKWDNVANDSPILPQKIHDKVAKNFPSKYFNMNK